MNTVKETLEKITRTWNSFFWDNKFCQGQINFTTEVRTNYYGDILNYFNDTIDFLEDFEFYPDFQKSIFQAIGTLQTIYIHQDLVDELLYIFRLHKSTKQDKNPNRQIRNELVGHPIRRIEGELISSVFFGREFKNGIIHYILYSKENNFQGKEVFHSIQSLAENHQQYLEKFTGIIWKRIERILRQLQKKLLVINSLLERNVDFNKLLNVVNHYYNQIYKDNYLFEPMILSECFNRQNEHPRYMNTINLFVTTLGEYLNETNKYIDDLFQPKPMKWEGVEMPKIEVVFVSMSEEGTEKPNKPEYLHYEFSKLFEKHPVFGLDYFVKKFESEPVRQCFNVACKYKMTPNYTYVNSTDYINNLSFDYVETYSFQRGEEYDRNLKLLKAEYDKIKALKDHDKTLTSDEEEHYEELSRLVGVTQYLIDSEGRFHPSSKKINTFPHDHPAVGQIKEILQTDIEDVPRWLCSPVYRDGLVFYDRDKRIVSALNICLSCQYMETKMFAHINGDYKTYDLFKRFFLNIGHEVEDAEYSIVEQMEKLKHKYGKL